MSHLYLSPSLMCADCLNLGHQLDILEKNNFDFFHIDIMDAHFVPNLALNFDSTLFLKKYRTPKDIHLMVENVSQALGKISVNKSDYVSFHIETMDHIEENITYIRNLGANPGVVINPYTPIEEVYPYLEKVNLIHLMTVQPGFVGQHFISDSYQRAGKLVKKIKELKLKNLLLGVDGGIGFEQISKFSKEGINVFVLGTTCLFNGKNFKEQAAAVIAFKKTLEKKHV